MLIIFKEMTVQTFMLAFSAPFVHLILLQNLTSVHCLDPIYPDQLHHGEAN